MPVFIVILLASSFGLFPVLVMHVAAVMTSMVNWFTTIGEFQLIKRNQA